MILVSGSSFVGLDLHLKSSILRTLLQVLSCLRLIEICHLYGISCKQSVHGYNNINNRIGTEMYSVRQ